MPITTNLNTAPYFDDFNEAKKYYRILFKPSVAVQARELTQIQTTLQSQIERFGNNIFKEGSIVEGCSFTELTNLKYVKTIDGINPETFLERTEFDSNDQPVDFWYELEGATSGLKAFVVSGQRGFMSDGVNLNTFFINYLNTNEVGGIEQKEFIVNESLLIREYKLIRQTVNGEIIETVIDNGIVSATNVATVTDYVGRSLGLTVSSGIVYQRGHFLLVDEQTIILEKYYDKTATDEDGNFLPHNLAAGFHIDETIVTSQQDATLLDNAMGSPNENARGADRLMLTPVFTFMKVVDADESVDFFTLRRYMNGVAISTRDVSSYNVIGDAMAGRTYEESGDYSVDRLKLESVRRANGDIGVKLSPNAFYSKGYRVENSNDRFFKIDDITSTSELSNQIISFEYGGYFEATTTAAGLLNLNTLQPVAMLNSGGTVIGHTFVKNVEDNRIYIFSPKMTGPTVSVSDVVSLKEGANAVVAVNPMVMESINSRLVFRLPTTGMESTEDVRIMARVSKTGLTVAANKLVIPASAGETFTAQSLNNITVMVAGVRTAVTSATYTPSELTINLAVATGAATAYYSVEIAPTAPRVLQKFNYFVKADFTSAKSVYSLGIPNVTKLISVKTGAGVDYSKSFSLDNNQNDDYYNHSFVSVVAGKPIPTNGQLTFEFEALVPSSSGSVTHLFTVDSYTDMSLSEIPKFTAASGEVMHLSDCIDFRPYRQTTSTPSLTAAGATVYNGAVDNVSSAAVMFSADENYVIPADNSYGYIDAVSFNSRFDVLAINSFGDFFVKKGEESKTPRIPDVGDATVVATVFVPSSPALTQQEAVMARRTDHELKISPVIAPRMTMKEIHKLKNTVEDIRHYVALSALEKSAQDMLITDADGLDRFKSGIIVDSFNSFGVADIGDPNFKAAIDTKEGVLKPSFNQYHLDLDVISSSGVSLHDGKVATAAVLKDVEFISQNKATSYRTCTSNFYSFVGNGELSPSYDAGYDTITTPKVSIDIDLSSSFNDLLTNIQQFIPLSSSSTTTNSSTAINSSVAGNTTTTTATTTSQITDIVRSIQSSASTYSAGGAEYLTDFQFEPYIRSNEVKVYMSGLRPNTNHYFYFDTVPVSAHVAPATIGSNGTMASIARSGAYGSSVKTNAAGELFAVFRIPSDTFFVGDRVLEILDVDDYDSIDSGSISSGRLTYHAYNFTATKGSFGINVRDSDFSVSTTTTNRTVVSRQVSVSVAEERGNAEDQSGDPLAQTFFVKKGANGSNEVYVTKLDLFFKRKSAMNGVTVMLREVENGYPSNRILPFSSIHLKPSQVNVSDNGSAVTSIRFQAPVRLSTETEYAFVVMPDANDPDYLIYTARVGEANISNGVPVNQDWGEGVLFTSTNNRAWQSYQGEDVKFILHRAQFDNSASPTIKLAPSNHEFLTLAPPVNTFVNGEIVYVDGTGPTSMSVASGSRVLNGSTAGFVVGGAVKLTNGNITQIVVVETVNAVDSNIIVDAPILFTSASTEVTKVVSAKVRSYDYRQPNKILLSNSTATSEIKFATGAVIRGLESGAFADVVSVDDLRLSFVKPMINRQTNGLNTVTGSYDVIDPESPTNATYTAPLSFVSNDTFKERGMLVCSKSNGAANAIKTGLVLRLVSGYGDGFSTPMLDIEAPSLFAYENILPASYISKVVTLEDGFDATDFEIFLTSYRPSSTDIDVYVRLKNASDFARVRDNGWVKLESKSKDRLYSSLVNEEDYREFSYTFPDSAMVSVGGDRVVEYTNSNGKYQGFQHFQIRIDLKSSDVKVAPMIKDYRGIALR